MLLTMVAAAVVSTASLSTLMVKNAVAEAPTPAANLAALLAPPTVTPRCAGPGLSVLTARLSTQKLGIQYNA